MAKTAFKTVDEYMASQPPATRTVLERVRAAICKALPEAEAVISYQIAAFSLNGRCVVYFAGWKNHYSLYPATERVVAALKDDLAPYEISKGTIRFPLDKPVPARLIGRIAKLRAREESEREKRQKR